MTLRLDPFCFGLLRNGKILEVGCSSGANQALLAEFGRVVGLDMNARAIELAKKNSVDVPAAHDALRRGCCPEDLSGLNERFDLICLFDVLEHIEQDSATLRALSSLLKPDGVFMLTVPSHQWMWGPHGSHFYHQRRYTHGHLAECCAHTGLVVSRLSYFNTLLFPLVVVARAVERLTGRKSEAATEVPTTLLNSTFRFVFSLKHHSMPFIRLPFGLSLLMLAKPVSAEQVRAA